MPADDTSPPPMSPTLARAALLDIVTRMSDADVVALMRLLCAWALEPTTAPQTRRPAGGAPAPRGDPDVRP